MPKLSQPERDALDAVARHNFLEDCKKIGFINQETFDKLVFQMGSKNMDRVNYYLKRFKEHQDDTIKFLDGNK
jgi:hypothetical protein